MYRCVGLPEDKLKLTNQLSSGLILCHLIANPFNMFKLLEFDATSTVKAFGAPPLRSLISPPRCHQTWRVIKIHSWSVFKICLYITLNMPSNHFQFPYMSNSIGESSNFMDYFPAMFHPKSGNIFISSCSLKLECLS